MGAAVRGGSEKKDARCLQGRSRAGHRHRRFHQVGRGEHWRHVPRANSKKEMKKAVKYTLHDEDDEEDDTVETRKSVKTAEKALKHRFFINAKEKKMYDRAVAEGKVNPKQVTFEEDEDEELGPADPTKAFREAVKKRAKLDALKAKKEEKAKEMEDAIAESKKDTAANATPEPKKDVSKELPKTEAPPKAPTASDLPPELAGELE